MQRYIVLRTHTSACRQRHLKWSLESDGLEKAKKTLEEKQNAVNKTGLNVEMDAILGYIDDIGLVHDYPSPVVVLASR